MLVIVLRRVARITRNSVAALVPLLAATAVLHAQTPVPGELPPEAFTIALDQPIPVSPRVITGEFANGIRYYIRENAQPVNRAELRLVVDVGSVLEDDDQLGLAHFVEHMAFNGTRHFEKQALLGFMRSIGMQLGPEVNASTSFDETIYQLQLPTDDASYMATAFTILEDWATGLTLDAGEIDLERGVVIEEWRLGQGAQSRIRDRQFPIILKDSRYALRLPIGTLESLQNASPDALRRFYRDWYRPELMAVIAVGDFDSAQIERLVREHFEAIPASANRRERSRYGVPDHDETLFAITTDPEMPVTQLAVYHKMPFNDDWTVGGYRQRIVEQLYDAMLTARFEELSRQPNPPLLGAASTQAPLVRPLAAHVLAAAVPETGIERGLETLLIEARRVARFGFTDAELERQKAAALRLQEQQYTNRESRSSRSHAAELIRAYLTGESVPGEEYELALHARFVPGITRDEVNRVGENWHDANRVVTVTAPDKPGLVIPAQADLNAVIAAAADAQIEPYQETASDQPLLATKPQGSKVTATRNLDGGLIEWDLANGVRVVLKPTDFRKDEIVFAGFSPGGTSLASDDDLIPANTATTIIGNGGLGAINATELQRMLTGRIANVTPYISDFEEGLRGNGSPADLETLLQLIYLRMTAPRADAAVYSVFNTQSRAVLQNRAANPTVAFEDAFNRALFQDHPRRQPPTVEMLDKTDLARSLAFYKDRFGDASDFTFIFVGSMDLEVMQPLVETYLGGLPTSGREESWRDLGIRNPVGVVTQTLRRGIEPQSRTRIAFTGPFDVDNQLERTRLSAATQLLETRLLTVMREQLGGTNSVQVNRQMNWLPVDAYLVSISFGSDPERADELTARMFAEIESLKGSGPTASEVADTHQALMRAYEAGLTQNNFWLSQLTVSYSAGVKPGASDILSYPGTVETVTIESVRDAFRQYFDVENHIRVTLLPEI